jgi:hypothetical protein
LRHRSAAHPFTYDGGCNCVGSSGGGVSWLLLLLPQQWHDHRTAPLQEPCVWHPLHSCNTFQRRDAHLLPVPQSSTVIKKGDAADAAASMVITITLASAMSKRSNQINAGDVHA